MKKDWKPWREYPIGTKAHASTGGHWVKVKLGWKWCTGATFPTPGGDVSHIEEVKTNNGTGEMR